MTPELHKKLKTTINRVTRSKPLTNKMLIELLKLEGEMFLVGLLTASAAFEDAGDVTTAKNLRKTYASLKWEIK